MVILWIFYMMKKSIFYEYADMMRLFLKHQHPKPKTHEFIVMAKYNNMMKKYVRNEIMKIV